MLYLPTQNWVTAQPPVTPRDTLNESASSASEQSLTVAAENAPLRVLYGTVTIGPQIACVLSYQGNLVILAVWGHGEVDSITALMIDDKATTVSATHYTGTAGQGVDATLVAAFAAQTPAQTYADALPGICYSVITVPPGTSSGFPRLTATIKGRKVWTGAANAWSNNPAYCMADFCTNTTYGMGKSVDWDSVDSVAADCDVLAGGTEPLRMLDLALDTVQPVQSWLDTLRTYASCWVAQSANGLVFVSDKAGASAATYAHASGQIKAISSVKKRGVQSTPTVMTITYRDTSTQPHRDGTAVVYAAGVLAGTTPRRESQVSLPGITRYSQAFREATERLNKLLLNDLSCSLEVFDEALAVDVGDIITVTHPIGLTDKLMRVMGVAGEYGRYNLSLVEYDPAVYSAAVATAPTWADTTLPNPAAPPAVSGIVMAEEVFQQQNGTYSSRWRVTWAAASYTFLAYYRAELWIGSTLIFAGSPSSAEWVTPPVQEAQTYTVKVAAVSSIGSTGTWGTQSGTALGKQLVPSNVPSISAFEAGGRVYASWSPSVDIDIWRYEVRYGSVGTAWASTILLDRVDALRLQTDQMPVGTWTLHVKCLDSVGNYSVAAATCNVVVTSDASAFLVSAYDQTAPTLTGMAEYTLARNDTNRYFVTEDAALWDTKFASTLNTYTNALATYHASMTSTWLGEAEDYGLDLGGQWTGSATVADISGTHISYFGSAMAAAPSVWTYTAGLSQKLNARFARLKHEALTTATLGVTIPTQSIRLDAVPREEVGTGTSSAAGPVTVTLVNKYVAVKKLTITPQGTTARSATFDNIVIGVSTVTFDVYVFSDAGTKIASPFRYEWQGV
jgi:hypothetical protein